MKWVKSGIAVLVTMCLLVLVGRLPRFVSRAQDETAKAAGLWEIRTVDLVLKEPLDMIEKLYALANGQYYPYSVNTVLTKDQLPQKVEEALRPYYYRNLIPNEWVDTVLRADSYILYRADDPEINFVLWIVILDSGGWQAQIHLDDETAKPLMIQFTYYTPNDAYDSNYAYSTDLKYAWFEALGLSEESWYEDFTRADANATTIRCYYADSRNITAELTIHPAGFWQFVVE